MKKFLAVLAAGALMATGTVCQALDTLKIVNKGKDVVGHITRMSPTEVEVELMGSGLPKTVPVNEITTIYFDEEPRQMQEGRKRLDEGKYKEALAAFEAAAAKAKREAVKQDVDYYKAYCKSQMALYGDEDIAAAGKEMIAFVGANKNNYHWLQANQVVGDLLVAMGKTQAAADYYAKVATAPWPDYKMRAGVAFGRALLSQDKPAEALKQFEEVLAQRDEGEQTQTQRTAAMIGKIRCQASDKSKAEAAIKEIKALLDKADADQTEVMAQGYTALGTAYRVLGRNTEAIHAFLHVELLYPSQPDAYAESQGNLMTLWKAENKPDREQRARQVLQDRFPKSPWLKKDG